MPQEKSEGGAYCRITPQIRELTRQWDKNAHIDRQLYEKYDVKRGLRDATGRGVLTSLTRISEVKGCTVDGQDTIPCPGVLYYRGYDVRDLEARALDAALILHADHGSNNSTFTNHVPPPPAPTPIPPCRPPCAP